MRAVQVVTLDGPAAVQLREVDEPTAGPGQVVIDVHFAGVAFPDLLLTRGRYQLKPPLPFSPGAEVAGVVRSAPAGSGFQPGDRVAALTIVGAWAETVAVDAASVFALPDAVSLAGGAGLLLNYLTMHFAYYRRAALRAGETVVVHGASGGIGVAALQLGNAVGARSIAVVSDERKAAVARDAGAHETVPVDGWKDRVLELTDGRGADVVCDPVGGDRFLDSVRCLGPEGRLLVIGFTAGEIPTVAVNRLLLKNVSVVGVGWGAFLMGRPGYAQEQWAELVPLLASGAVRAVEGDALPLADAAAALLRLERREATGKVVLALR